MWPRLKGVLPLSASFPSIKSIQSLMAIPFQYFQGRDHVLRDFISAHVISLHQKSSTLGGYTTSIFPIQRYRTFEDLLLVTTKNRIHKK